MKVFPKREREQEKGGKMNKTRVLYHQREDQYFNENFF